MGSQKKMRKTPAIILKGFQIDLQSIWLGWLSICSLFGDSSNSAALSAAVANSLILKFPFSHLIPYRYYKIDQNNF
jgi:hypothetical protein